MNRGGVIVATLFEETRNRLIARGKQGQREKSDGKTRYEKRVRSSLANSVKEFNEIDMNSVFLNGILTINVPVRGETDNYLVRIKFGGFLDILQREIKRLGKLDLRTIARALISAFNSDDVYIHCSCLHPSTKIRLLDGTSPTVEELARRFNSGENLYCFTVNEQGDFEPGKIENVWITKQATEFIEVTLDNGEVIKTTPEHLYMLRNGVYSQAKDLSVGDILTPSPRKIVDVKKHVETSPLNVYDISVEGNHNFMVDGGVILHNCKDFYYRFSYWLSVEDITSGPKQTIPSDETNPNNDLGSGCKHIMLVLSNTSWILKAASVINNYIKYMEKHRQNDYARYIYPVLYGKEYEEPVQLSIDDSDTGELDTSSDTLDVANEYGRTSGRFTTGNPYRFQRKETESPIRGQQEIDFEEETEEDNDNETD